MNLVDMLRLSRLCREMPKGLLESMAKRMTPRDYRKGEVLGHTGQPCERLVFVVDGSFLMLSADREIGLEFTSGSIQSGDFVGTTEVIANAPYQRTIRAAVDSRTFEFAAPLFRQLFKVPEVGVAIAAYLSRELRDSHPGGGIRFIDLNKQPYRAEIYQLVPARVLVRHHAVPLRTLGDRLVVGMVDPGDKVALDDIQRAARGYTVEPASISESAYKAFRQRYLIDRSHLVERSMSGPEGPIVSLEFISPESQTDTSRSAPIMGQEVVRLVNQIVMEGLNHSCSDIHIEPSAERLSVRYRVEGILIRSPRAMGMELHAAVVSRIKVLAKLDIAERRLPQEGRFGAKVQGRRIDFRVSIIPTKTGEKVVIRVLDPTNLLGRMNKIIYHEQTVQMIREMVLQPYGIVFVTGPTGSGKSTSLYCLLNERANDSVNVVTIEDPIEYDIAEIVQTQVHEDIGLGYGTLLRAFLRQDPDVILVGEIRDRVTAKTALEAALAGRFVMTSLHANTPAGTIYRLREMGLDPFLIGNAMIGAVGQRLLRRLCANCRTRMNSKHVLLDQFNAAVDAPEPLEVTWMGTGCKSCHGTGYHGRVAAVEVLRVTDELKALIMDNAGEEALMGSARRAGLVPFSNYCRFLVHEGYTSLEEALTILAE